MSFVDAIKICFTKYVDFNGRARRSEYWYWTVFNIVLSTVAGAIANVTGATAISTIVSLALLLPSLAVAVRRLHDIGKSWAYILFGLIPLVGWIILLVWYAKEGDAGDNAFGSDPKDV